VLINKHLFSADLHPFEDISLFVVRDTLVRKEESKLRQRRRGIGLEKYPF